MLITTSIALDQPGDFEALMKAIEHYKKPSADHQPDPRLVKALDSLLGRVVDSAEVHSRSTFQRPAKPQPD